MAILRKSATINIRISEELKKAIPPEINLSEIVRDLLIKGLKDNTLIKQAELEHEINRTKKILQIFNASKLIFARMGDAYKKRIITDQVIKTIERQKEATDDEIIKQICDAEITRIKGIE